MPVSNSLMSMRDWWPLDRAVDMPVCQDVPAWDECCRVSVRAWLFMWDDVLMWKEARWRPPAKSGIIHKWCLPALLNDAGYLLMAKPVAINQLGSRLDLALFQGLPVFGSPHQGPWSQTSGLGDRVRNMWDRGIGCDREAKAMRLPCEGESVSSLLKAKRNEV